MDIKEDLLKRALKTGDEFQENLNKSIEQARFSVMKVGYSLIGFVILISLIGDIYRSLFSTNGEFISDVKFVGLLFIGVVFVGLGHWMALDENRASERRRSELLEMRKQDLEHARVLEELNIKRLSQLPDPTIPHDDPERSRPT